MIDLFLVNKVAETNGGGAGENLKVICSLEQTVAAKSPSIQIIAKLLVTDDRTSSSPRKTGLDDNNRGPRMLRDAEGC